MPRLLSPLLVLLLKLWPMRSRTRARPRLALRPRGGLPGDEDGAADRALEAQARSRTRSTVSHRWAGEVIITAGTRRTVVPGIWSFSDAPRHRARAHNGMPALLVDTLRTDTTADLFTAQLSRLLTLQERGARLRVARADTQGWRTLEVRAPTSPETILEVDRSSAGRLLGSDSDEAQFSFRIFDEPL